MRATAQAAQRPWSNRQGKVVAEMMFDRDETVNIVQDTNHAKPRRELQHLLQDLEARSRRKIKKKGGVLCTSEHWT